MTLCSPHRSWTRLSLKLLNQWVGRELSRWREEASFKLALVYPLPKYAQTTRNSCLHPLCHLALAWGCEVPSKDVQTPLDSLCLASQLRFTSASWWLAFFFGIGSTGGSNLEGNPINRAFYAILILSAIVIVVRRGFSWTELIRRNVLLSVFFCYLALTVIWAVYPVPTMKRWIKEVGVIPVLLVIFTEEKPLEALKLIFTRSAFILFTYSIMVIKYIPELGRDYSHHSGVAQITGIAAQKNSLGEIVAVCGVFLLWQLLERWDGQLRHHFRAPALQLGSRSPWDYGFCINATARLPC